MYAISSNKPPVQ